MGKWTTDRYRSLCISKTHLQRTDEVLLWASDSGHFLAITCETVFVSAACTARFVLRFLQRWKFGRKLFLSQLKKDRKMKHGQSLACCSDELLVRSGAWSTAKLTDTWPRELHTIYAWMQACILPFLSWIFPLDLDHTQTMSVRVCKMFCFTEVITWRNFSLQRES